MLLFRFLLFDIDETTTIRLNHLALLNCHSDVLDQLNLSELVREFIGLNEVRQNEFGNF